MQAEAVSHCDSSAVWRKTDGDTEQRHEHHVIAARKLLIELTEQFVDRTGLSESTSAVIAQEELVADPKPIESAQPERAAADTSPEQPSSAH